MKSDKEPFTIDQAIAALQRSRKQLGGTAGIRFVDWEPLVLIEPSGDCVVISDRTGDEEEYQ